MFNEEDRKMCEMIHRDGVIMKDSTFTCEGYVYRQFLIYYTNYENGNIIEYHLTGKDGEWIYIHCAGIVGNIFN